MGYWIERFFYANELIVTGRGIGFQRHQGEIIDASLVERTYRMENSQAEQDEMFRQMFMTEHGIIEYPSLTVARALG